MRKILLLLLAGIFGGSFTAQADMTRARSLTPAQKQQIAEAIKILSNSKAISKSQYQNQCVQFDPDILKTLESEGHLQYDSSQAGVVCISGLR